MKKSHSIKLALLGSASMALVACGDDTPPDDAQFYSDAKACSAVYGDAPCTDAAAKAEETHLAQAPKYADKTECEAEFGAGNCETRQSASGGGSYFMPLLMGYMMGNMMGGNRFSQPVYRGRDGGAVMNNNGRLFNVGNFGNTAGRNATSFRPSQAMPVSRGGFGGSSMAFNSGAAS